MTLWFRLVKLEYSKLIKEKIINAIQNGVAPYPATSHALSLKSFKYLLDLNKDEVSPTVKVSFTNIRC